MQRMVSRVYFTVLMFVSALILARTYRSTPVFLVSLCLLLPEGLSMLVRYVGPACPRRVHGSATSLRGRPG